MNALRLNEGFEQREFEQRTGLAFEARALEPATLASARGLLERTAGALARERAGL